MTILTAPQAGAVAAERTDSKLTVAQKRLNVRAGRTAVVRGTLLPRQSHRIVRLERLQRGRWRQIDGDLTSRTGRYVLRYRTRGADTALVRVRFGGDPTARPSKRVVGRLNAFRPALASWYGPGLYGNALGCGGRLSPGTVGVAHKSLPCGTTIVLRNRSRVVRARVIDRGPYVGAREFDLTAATKRKLGFGSVGRVWVAH
ncbi:MAG TPA: septal ring lytic transglycosylase RlpA family protein [Solirubrobacteraceae bacterium]|nr:septal ring lytic transglycosylase RlpA family protein [Solirubrobacteraceae bacterium]